MGLSDKNKKGPPPARPAGGAPPPTPASADATSGPAAPSGPYAALDPSYQPSGDPIRCPKCGCNASVKTSRFRETNVGANFRQRWRECDFCHHVYCTIEQIL